jgi:predicted nucleotidyltransferase
MDLSRALELILERWPSVIAVYLFGSQATGAETGTSDVDLAVLAPTSVSSAARWTLQEDLAHLLRRDVDLVDLRAASTVLAAEVLRHGSVAYESDRTARAQYEMTLLADYADLNERRRAHLDEVARRGTVHG